VLFVDDEPHLLAGLRRMLRPQRDRWDISFASSGVEALTLLSSEPMDAIISDMRMPGMDGAQLLAEVQRKHPATARIILSGQADLESVLTVIRSAQQFLAKPCDVDVLIGTIDQALKVQRLLTQPALRELIGGVVSLPVLPAIYHELVALADTPRVDPSALAALLASDVAASASVLKLANSAFFGLPEKIASVQAAVLLLGVDNVQALLLTGSVFKVGEPASQGVEELQNMALRRAAVGRAIAGKEGWPRYERNLAVLSCMLRDVGGLVLAEGLPAAAAQLATAIADEPGPADPTHRAELEVAAYGCTIPQASAYLLGLWGFAPAVVHTIAGQPVTTPGPWTTRMEQVLGFAHLRVLDPDRTVARAPDPYLTAERMQAWNDAADEVFAR
jgi:HD-like signal output (HDOD) protein